jgi:hypothetical protein
VIFFRLIKMPYGRMTSVSKPSWLKDAPSTTTSTSTSTTSTPTTARPSWSARRAAEAAKIEESADATSKSPIAKVVKKDISESPKKEVTTKLQSREIKVPLKVEKTIPTQPILKKPETSLRDSKTPSKSPAPSSDRSSKSPSTFSSKTPSTVSSSKSPSKTPDFDDEEEEEEEESSEESEEESSEEETDSDDDFDFEEEERTYKAPTPPPSKTALNLPTLRKVQQPADEKTQKEASPETKFKKPELKKVVTRQKSESKIRERSKSPEAKFIKPKLRKVPSSLKAPAFKEKLPTVELKRPPPKPEPEPSRKMTEQFPAKPSVVRAESNLRSELKKFVFASPQRDERWKRKVMRV